MSIEISHASELAKDGGSSSRKLWLTIATMLLIVGVSLLSALAVFSALGPNLPTVLGSLLGALGLYLGANVGVKFASTKTAGGKPGPDGDAR